MRGSGGSSSERKHEKATSEHVQPRSGPASHFKRSEWSPTQLSIVFGANRARSHPYPPAPALAGDAPLSQLRPVRAIHRRRGVRHCRQIIKQSSSRLQLVHISCPPVLVIRVHLFILVYGSSCGGRSTL